jgi:hypothetical protein
MLALLLRTLRLAPSVASTVRSPSDRPHNSSAILQQHPVSLLIYERTHIDSVSLPPISPLRPALQRQPQWSRRGTSKPTNFILFTDWLLSLVAVRFGLTDSQRNPRAANRSRSFHDDNQDVAAPKQYARLGVRERSNGHSKTRAAVCCDRGGNRTGLNRRSELSRPPALGRWSF